MPDLFDAISPSPQGDIFDQVAPSVPFVNRTTPEGIMMGPLVSSGGPNQSYYESPQSGGMINPLVPVQLVRHPQDVVEGAYNSVVKGLSSLTSPLGLATAPLASVKALQLPIMTILGALGIKGGAEVAGEQLAGPTNQYGLPTPTPGLTPGQRTEGVGDFLQNAMMAAPMVHGALGKVPQMADNVINPLPMSGVDPSIVSPRIEDFRIPPSNQIARQPVRFEGAQNGDIFDTLAPSNKLQEGEVRPTPSQQDPAILQAIKDAGFDVSDVNLQAPKPIAQPSLPITTTKEVLGRDPTEHLEYSPEDLSRYNELKPKTIAKSVEEFGSPEFQSNWKEFEDLRNKYNGNPPQQMVAKAINPIEPTKLHSGVDSEAFDWAGRQFVMQSEKLLRNAKELGFASGAQVSSDQLKNRIRNKLGENSSEWKMLEGSGINEYLKEGKKTPGEVADWVKDNGPKVEVRKFGQGVLSNEQREAAILQHKFDTLGKDPHDSTLNWTPEQQIDRKRLMELNKDSRSWSESSNAHWQSIAPKSESEMPGYVEIAVTKQGKKLGPKGNDWVREQQFPSSHNFPPNTLGFVRGYMEHRPDGGKTFHVIEVQSDWAQQIREDKKFMEEHPTNMAHKENMSRFKDDALLGHYERLALKAAIEHAQKEGADRVAVSDAETAMMTEGHDRDVAENIRLANDKYKLLPEELEPDQEKGMRLHYDQTLPKILGELTGSKGERREFGIHKNALEDTHSNTDISDRIERKDLIFKNEKGEPKTSISAREFDINKPKERLEKGEPMTSTGKLYGGLPFADPDLYRDVAKNAIKLAQPVIDKIVDQLKTGEISRLMPEKFDAIKGVAQSVANQIGHNIEGPLERMFGKKDLAQAKEALSLVRESQEVKEHLQGQLDQAKKGALDKLPKWRYKWVNAAEFALKNWDKLTPLGEKYKKETDSVLSRLSDVDRPVEKRAGYVRHIPEESESPTGFRQERIYGTFFDRIKAGSNPKNMDSVSLLKSTIYDAQKSYIQTKAFNDWMTKVKEPKSGKQLAVDPKNYEVTKRVNDGKEITRVPSGYIEKQIGGQKVAILKDYANLIDRLANQSILDKHWLGKGVQNYSGLSKHIEFAFDFVHLRRMMNREMGAKIGNGKLPIPSWRKGILTLDFSPQELQAKAKAGDFPEKLLPKLLENRSINNNLIQGGFNVGHYADAIRESFLDKIPISGHVQKFIFNTFTRGAMAEVGPITYRQYKAQYPKLTEQQLISKTIRDLNFTFANMGKQGWIKSATMQDILRVFIAAPQWTEATPRYEMQAIGGAAKGIYETVKNTLTKGPMEVIKDPSLRPFNLQSRTIGGIILGTIVANQILNYAFQGKSTFENEDGHKLDAKVPIPGGKTYWVEAEASALEAVHRLGQVMDKTLTPREAALEYAGPKLSVGGRSVAEFVTGKKYGLTGPLLKRDEVAKDAALGLVKPPIISNVMKKDQFVPQLMKSAGLEGSVEPTDRSAMFTLARKWKTANGVKIEEGEFPASQYAGLNNALRNSDMETAQNELQSLRNSGVGDVLLQRYYKNYPDRGFTGNDANESKFADSLTTEQRVQYDKARQSNEEVKQRFFEMIGESAPDSAHEVKGRKKRSIF